MKNVDGTIHILMDTDFSSDLTHISCLIRGSQLNIDVLAHVLRRSKVRSVLFTPSSVASSPVQLLTHAADRDFEYAASHSGPTLSSVPFRPTPPLLATN